MLKKRDEMTKEEIFEVLMQAEAGQIQPLAETLGRTIPHHVLKGPAQELIMFQAEESVEKIDFNVGEILVTTARIKVNDAIGFAMVMDMDEEKAQGAALLIGIIEANLPESDQIRDLVAGLKDYQLGQLREEREIISSTRVNFEVMGGQDPNINHNAQSK